MQTLLRGVGREVAAPLQLPILQEWLRNEIFDDKYGAFILV